MIYTTYFPQLKHLPENIFPISICAKPPAWYKGAEYKQLAPKYGFFMRWKETHDNDYYINHFNSEVLDTLIVSDVLNELNFRLSQHIKDKLNVPIQESSDWHIALVCFEKPEDFCHRHLVAKWLQDNGIKCSEWVR